MHTRAAITAVPTIAYVSCVSMAIRMITAEKSVAKITSQQVVKSISINAL